MGDFYGMVFQDSDVVKWLEVVVQLLCQKFDFVFEKIVDEVIELVVVVQCDDGYFNMYFMVKVL